MDDVFSSKAGASAGQGSGSGGETYGQPGDDFSGGGIRLEAIVRHHRRRCALKTEALAAEQLRQSRSNSVLLNRRKSSSGSGGGTGGSGGGGGSLSGGGSSSGGLKSGRGLGLIGGGGHQDEWKRTTEKFVVGVGVGADVGESGEGEAEAMAAAAGKLADPAVIGKLFDSILPHVAASTHDHNFSSSEEELQGFAVAEGDSGGGGGSGDDNADDDDDPVLALCAIYADVVMEGVRAGPAAAADSTARVTSVDSAPAATPGKSVLNAVAFGRPKAPIAARLWSYLQRRHDLDLYAQTGEGQGTGEKGVRGGRSGGGGIQSALFLFCSACR